MLHELQTKALIAYLFGKPNKPLEVKSWSFEVSKKTGRLKYIRDSSGNLLFVMREDGTLAPSLLGARVLLDHGSGFNVKVVMQSKLKLTASKYDVPSRYIKRVSGRVRPRTDVLLIDEEGSLYGVGRAVLSSHQLKFIKSGIAVKVRKVSRQV
jgi:uncharacterized protein with predicted RNA binding PUA domain